MAATGCASRLRTKAALRRVVCRAVVAGALATGALAACAHDAIAATYARFLSGGRGDVELHFTGAGSETHATTEPLGDGLYRCRVSGLDAGAGAGADDTVAAALSLTSRLIHETTHCQTSPYTVRLRERADEAPDVAEASQLLLALTLESVADARVVLEIARVDGLAAARVAAQMAMPAREFPASPAHSTAAALRGALSHAERTPQALATPDDSFAAALHVGLAAAWPTLRALLKRQGRETLADNAAVSRRRNDLAASLQDAANAFANGRHDNRAATLRAWVDRASPDDRHFFVLANGEVRTQPALGAEGAHQAGSMQQTLQGRTAPVDRIALQWLQCQGALDPRSFERLSLSLSRLMRHFTDGSPAQTARAAQVLGTALERCRPGEGHDALFDTATDALHAALAKR